jgi:osmotically-inducible protein OsmY
MYGAGGSYTGESYRGSYSGGGTYGVGGLQSGSWGTSGGSGWNRPMSGSMERYGSEGMQGERSFRGRGPKGYTRSDERIREDVNDRLTDEDSIDAGEIEVSVESGEVTLAGSVPDREMKRRVEDLVESLSGVKNVQNNLRVKREVSLSERGSERGSERSNEYSSSTGSRSSSSSSATAGYGSKSNR